MTVEISPTEIVTPPLRLAFPALFEPKPTFKGSDENKYQAALLIPDDVDLGPFYDCVKAAMVDKWGKAVKLPTRSNPIKSCDEKELDGYAEGWHFINTKSGFQPNVIDQKRQEILDVERIFAGCWCRFHLTAYAWDHQTGGKGVSFSLNAVQLVREDARLDGRRAASDVFDAIEVDVDGIGSPDQLDNLSDTSEDLFG